MTRRWLKVGVFSTAVNASPCCANVVWSASVLSCPPRPYLPACPRCYLISNTWTVSTAHLLFIPVKRLAALTVPPVPHKHMLLLLTLQHSTLNISEAKQSVIDFFEPAQRHQSAMSNTHTPAIKKCLFFKHTLPIRYMNEVCLCRFTQLSHYGLMFLSVGWVPTHCVLHTTYSSLISCVHIKVFRLGPLVSVVLFNLTTNLGFFLLCSTGSTSCVIDIHKQNKKTWFIHFEF